MAITDVQVVEIVKGWKFTVAFNFQSGQRTFIDASLLPAMTAESLPDIGDKWSNDFPNCLCKTIDVTYFNDDDECGKQYVCNYDSNPIDDSQGATNEIGQSTYNDEKNLPTSIETSAEFCTLEPKFEYLRWYYGQTNVDAKQPIFFIANTATIKIARVFSDNNLDTFLSHSLKIQGKLNDKTFMSIPTEMLLYNGANLTQFTSAYGIKKRKWRAELTFTFRSVTGDWTGEGKDGWNWLLNEEIGKWDKPYRWTEGKGWTESGFLYDTADFEELLKYPPSFFDTPNILNLTT